MFSRFLIILFPLLVAVSPWAMAIDSLSARVDRNPAMAGETIMLEVVAEGSVSTNDLDTSALTRQFIVGRTNVSRSTQIINGNTSNTTSWHIALMVRKPGNYLIPAFTLDGEKTQPIVLNVVAAESTGQQANQDVMLRSTLNASDGYVGQQLIYTSTLYLAVDLQRGNLQAPELPGADVQQIGEDQNGTDIVDGKRYNTISRSYAITPNQAGEQVLKGAVFSGEIRTGRGGFFGAGRSKPISAIDDDQTLTIKAIPDTFPGQWLVSDIVILQEEWPEKVEFRVGEPVTRALTLTATNINKEQLPEIPQHYPPQIQLYPDKAQSQQAFQDNRNIAQKTQSIALIPAESGQLLLPELRLPWFNSQTNALEWATLPARTINVLPALNQGTSTIQPAPAATPVNTPVAVPHAVDNKPQQSPLWQWSTALFASLWLITLAAWFNKKRQSPSHATVKPRTPKESNRLWEQLQQACQANQSGDISRLMPLWIQQHTAADISVLGATAPELAKIYQQYQQASYSKEATTGSTDTTNTTSNLARELLTLLKQLKQQSQVQSGTINPLYPDH